MSFSVSNPFSRLHSAIPPSCVISTHLSMLSPGTLLQAKLHGARNLDLVPALRILCKPRSSQMPLKLLTQLPWAAALQGWSNIHQQHDAPELVTHLLPRLGINHVAGQWEARWSVQHHVQVFDHGTLLAPIIMSLPPGGHLHLQQVIHQWHTQARPACPCHCSRSSVCAVEQVYRGRQRAMS